MKTKKKGNISKQLFIITFLVMVVFVALVIFITSFVSYSVSVRDSFGEKDKKYQNFLTTEMDFYELYIYKQQLYYWGLDAQIVLEDGTDFYQDTWVNENWYIVYAVNEYGETFDFALNEFFLKYYEMDSKSAIGNEITIAGYNSEERTIDAVVIDYTDFNYYYDEDEYRYPFSLDGNYSLEEQTMNVTILNVQPKDDVVTIDKKAELYDTLKEYTYYYTKNYTEENRVLKPNKEEVLVDYKGREIKVSYTYFAASFIQYLESSSSSINFVSMLSILISLGIAFVYSKLVAKPIVKMNQVTKEMAQLNFSNAIDVSYNNEIGELATNINLLSDSLDKSIKQLENDIEVRKEFVANFSHDIKTPLGVMKCYIESLQCNINAEKKDEYYDMCLLQIDKMSDMVNKVLTVSSYEQDNNDFMSKLQEVDMMNIIENTVESLKKKCAELNKKIIIKGIVSNTYGDYAKIERVVNNLLENAIKHSVDNDTITVSMEKAKNGYNKISFSNQCADITEDETDKFFNKFYVGDKSRSKTSTGLGLYICAVLLKQHNFEYGIETKDNYITVWFEYPDIQ